MTTLEFLLAGPNQAFLVAILVTLLIAAAEVASLLMGLGLSNALDSLLPDLDVDLEADGLDSAEGGILAEGFSWLNVGRVPLLVLLISFLTLFAGLGLLTQWLASAVIGLLPGLLVAPAAALAAVPLTRAASAALARVIPREETYAVSADQFVGLIAKVTLGPVRHRIAGRARVTDRFGNTHNVRVRGSKPGARFTRGQPVLLVGHKRGLFEVIAPPASLSETNQQR